MLHCKLMLYLGSLMAHTVNIIAALCHMFAFVLQLYVYDLTPSASQNNSDKPPQVFAYTTMGVRPVTFNLFTPG